VRIPLAVSILAFLSLTGARASQPPPPTIAVSPSEVSVGLHFTHGSVRAEGAVAPGDGVVVVLSSEPSAMELVRVERKGPLWVVGRKFRADGIPRACLVLSSSPLARVAPANVLTAAGIGGSGIEAGITVTGDENRELVAGEVVRRMTGRGYYELAGGGATVGPDGRWRAVFDVPPRIPGGTYSVTARAVRGGRLSESASAMLTVRKSGVEAAVLHLARHHAWFYGLLCVLSAMGLGVLAGLGGSPKRAGEGAEVPEPAEPPRP
jgi:hypothetical protein